MFFILDGMVSVYDDDGIEIIATLYTHSFFGEMAISRGKPASRGVIFIYIIIDSVILRH